MVGACACEKDPAGCPRAKKPCGDAPCPSRLPHHLFPEVRSPCICSRKGLASTTTFGWLVTRAPSEVVRPGADAGQTHIRGDGVRHAGMAWRDSAGEAEDQRQGVPVCISTIGECLCAFALPSTCRATTAWMLFSTLTATGAQCRYILETAGSPSQFANAAVAFCR